MQGALFFDPATAGALWLRWAPSADQPDLRSFELDGVESVDGPVSVRQRAEALSPFVRLTSLQRSDSGGAGPPVLLTPPMAGGFPFILRDMAAALVQSRPVHVIEWLNARRIPEEAGRFGFDDQVEAIAAAAERIDQPAHWIAVCQAGPPSALAAATTAARGGACAPLSLTVVGAPMDADAAPSSVAAMIRRRDRRFYEAQLRRRAPPRTGGAGRWVYPAEAQRAAVYATLAAQSPREHEFARLIRDNGGADPDRVSFLDMATSLMDLPAEQFIEALERVYLAPEGPCAGLSLRGAAVDPTALAETPLMTIAGGKDQVASPGQVAAALSVFPAAPGVARRSLVAEEAGHFGLFYGPRWREEVAPALSAFLSDVEGGAQDGADDPGDDA